jgi:hypothetical protein
MQRDPLVTSRRAGLAGAAAFFLSALSRSATAVDAPDDRLPPPCCGNGPPNVARYGVGTQVLPLEAAGPDFQFKDPTWGQQGSKSQYVWVFVTDLGVIATSYTDPDGNQQPVISYTNPPGFKGIAFVVAPGFTLDLRWPQGHQPSFSTRPLGRLE